MRPAIVVVAYDRPKSLRRILSSLANARVPDGTQLVISIDRSGHALQSVLAVAEGFSWRQGEKQILVHPVRLGLREHILRCGDLSQIHGAIIVLEDDLYVSPEFYEYTQAAIAAYENDPQIAGISLYAHRFNETAALPFHAFEDGSDCYFLQMPSSWGQCWTSDQWRPFRRWYDANHTKPFDAPDMPWDVLKWPETSWKKYFVKYLATTDRYFVYPRISLATNFGDPGTHFQKPYNYLQVSLLMAPKRYRFIPLQTSVAVYDSHCEILPAKLKQMTTALASYEFETDLYGRKGPDRIKAPYVLTGRRTRDAIMRFGLELKPHELNIIRGIEGSSFNLARLEDCTTRFAEPEIPRLSFYHGMHPYWIERLQRALTEATTQLNALRAQASQASSLRWLARQILRVLLQRLRK